MKKENTNKKNSMQYLLEEDLSNYDENALTDILEIIKKEQPDYIKIRTAIHFSKDTEEAYKKLKRLKKNIEVFEQNKEISDEYKNTINDLSKSLKEIKEVILLFHNDDHIDINNHMNDEDIFWLDEKGTLTQYTEEEGYVYNNIINDKVDYHNQFFSIQQYLLDDDHIHDRKEEQYMEIEQRVKVFCGCIDKLIKNNQLNDKQTKRLNNLKQDIHTAFETIKDRHIGISADNTTLFLRCNDGIKIWDLTNINNNNKYDKLIKDIKENILLGKIYDWRNRFEFTSKEKQKEILEDFVTKMNKLTENKKIEEIFNENQLATVKKMFNQIKCTMEVINNNNFIIDEDGENIYFRNGKRKTVGNEKLLEGPDNIRIDAYKIPLYKKEVDIEQLAKAIGRKILLKTVGSGIRYFKNRYRRSCGSSQDKMNNFNEIIVLEKQQLKKDIEQLRMGNNNSKNEDNNELNKNDNNNEQINKLKQKIEWLNELQTKVKEYIVCDAAYQKLHTEKHKAVSLIRKNRIRNKMEYVVKMRENDGIEYNAKDLKEIEKHTPNGIEVLAGKYNEKWYR